MKRDATGKFVRNWHAETKQRVSLSITNTAWRLLDEMAQQRGLSRSELIEHYARSVGQEERFQQIVDAIPQIVWTCKPTGEVESFNQQALAAFGISLEQLFVDGWYRIVHPEDLQPTIDAWTAAVTTGSPYQIEYRLRMADGTYRWHLARALPNQDETGRITRWFGTCTDIDDRKHLEHTLQQQADGLENERQWLKAVLNQLPTPLMFVELETAQLSFSNRAAVELAGGEIPRDRPAGIYDEQFYCTDADGQIVPPEQLPAVRLLRGESIRGAELNWHTPSGTYPLLVHADNLPAMHGHSAIGVMVFQDIRDRKRIEQALRHSEARVRAMVNQAAVGMAQFTLDGQFRDVNPALCELTGYSPEELLQCSWQDITHPADIEPTTNHIQQLISEEISSACLDKRYLHKDGSVIWVDLTLSVVRNSRGQPEYLVGIIEDITDRKRIEAERNQLLERENIARTEIENAKRQLATLFETSPIGVALLNAEQQFIAINQALAEINGLSRSQHLNRTIAELFSASDPTLVEVFAEIYATGNPFVATNFAVTVPGRSDRSPGYYDVYYLPNRQFCSRVESVLVYVVDVTERYRLEDAQRFLSEASSVLASSLDSQVTLTSIAQLVVPQLADWCSVYILNDAGMIQPLAVTHANPETTAWAKELQQRYSSSNPGVPKSVSRVIRTGQSELYPDISDRFLVDVAHDADHLQLLRELGLKSAMIVPLKVHGRILGAISFTAAESGRRYTATDLALAEELGRRAALAVDNAQLYAIAQRDRAASEVARRAAESANRIKDEFLAVLSHELRSPLNPILGWTKILQTRKLDQAKTVYALDTIERNAKLQAQLIEDLLDVSRILQGKTVLNIAPVNLPTAIESALETVRLAAEAKKIQIQTTFNAVSGVVLGDTNRLQQVIWNLLSNAVKFTPAGGQVQVRLEQDAASVQILVTDSGKGINPEFLPHVFDYFRQEDGTTTRQFGGLGLGLAIVRHLTELHGGTVAVDSPGQNLGATFTIRLPLNTTDAHDLSAEESTLNAPLSARDATQPVHTPLTGLHILVVDDEVDMRELALFVLAQHGAQVAIASSAAQALTLLAQSTPDLLLCDIGMPDMDGYSLLRQLRQRSPEQGGTMPAIALTAYAGEMDRQQALAAGFQIHLTKPIEPDVLVDAIVNITGRSSA